MGDITGSGFIPQRLTREVYLNFLEEAILEFLGDVLLVTRIAVWFMQDAPSYFSMVVCYFFHNNVSKSLVWLRWDTRIVYSNSRLKPIRLFFMEISEVIPLRYSIGEFGLFTKSDNCCV